jgi:hypothetical protein
MDPPFRLGPLDLLASAQAWFQSLLDAVLPGPGIDDLGIDAPLRGDLGPGLAVSHRIQRSASELG